VTCPVQGTACSSRSVRRPAAIRRALSDPLSSQAYNQRQTEYAGAAEWRGLYTRELVVTVAAEVLKLYSSFTQSDIVEGLLYLALGLLKPRNPGCLRGSQRRIRNAPIDLRPGATSEKTKPESFDPYYLQ
jgi:hypothetical protein